MISQDNTDWNSLEDAYGGASKIPTLLEMIANVESNESETENELWQELWSRVCHQGSIYSASFAAAAQIINMIPEQRSQININLFLLPLCVEIARQQTPGKNIPQILEASYFSALKKMNKLIEIYESDDNAESLNKVIQAIHLVSSGNTDQAEKILEA